jgi:hypothetical protein
LALETNQVESVEAIKPHWSHLPIWGTAAAERGFQLPLPFGVGVNYYRERQPFDIGDLQIALPGGDPVSISDFATLEQVITTQSALTTRIDAWLFPFLNFYGILGYTDGQMEGTIGLPAIPPLGIPAQDLPLRIGYRGPTFGGGATLAGGAPLNEEKTLTLFVVADANYTVTDLEFTDEALFTDTQVEAFVFSSRVGLRAKLSELFHGGLWVGTMYQDVSEFLIGRAADQSFAFLVVQKPSEPWNLLVGGRLEIGRNFDVIVEGGIGGRESILGGVTFRF